MHDANKIIFLFVLFVTCGCAGQINPLPSHAHDSQVPLCRDFLESFDRGVVSVNGQDIQTVAVPHFPGFRVNRFFASFRSQLLDEVALRQWLQAMAQLAVIGRQLEYQNLSTALQNSLLMAVPVKPSMRESLQTCATVLVDNVIHHVALQRQLQANISVPDNYSLTKRIIGVYPISSLAVALGVNKLHQETAKKFQRPLDEIPLKGKLSFYGPPITIPSVFPKINGATQKTDKENALGMPLYTISQWQSLWERHAPILAIDTISSDDRIGSPIWLNSNESAIDMNVPAAYQKVSYARMNKKILVQLNYIFWFPARSSKGRFDIYAGKFDGLIWRVTLAQDGQALIYDSVHHCGCYHKFYPTEHMQAHSNINQGFEPPVIAQYVASQKQDERVLLRISHATHFIERVLLTNENDIRWDVEYRFVTYQKLRSLALPTGEAKSFFNYNGLVSGSERPERWLLWPMGVRSPGAMRQWGTQAIAFIGKRHFDDPYLIDKFFKRISTN